jgi:hypothetical protein
MLAAKGPCYGLQTGSKFAAGFEPSFPRDFVCLWNQGDWANFQLS